MGKLYPVWRKLNYILKWEYFGSLPRSSVHISPSVRRQEWEGENPIFYSVCISHRPYTALTQKKIGKVHYLNHCKMTQHLSSEVIVGGTKTATRIFHRRKLGRRECRRPGQWLHITYSGGGACTRSSDSWTRVYTTIHGWRDWFLLQKKEKGVRNCLFWRAAVCSGKTRHSQHWGAADPLRSQEDAG